VRREGARVLGHRFLEDIAAGSAPAVGDAVVIIGGGNTALDCTRSALRLGPRSVRVIYRRTQAEMPCSMDEVAAAEAEGVNFNFLAAPLLLERNGGSRLRLTCCRMRLGEPDASGRRRPEVIAGSEFEVRCSTVVAAIGQSVERSVAERERPAPDELGIEADRRTLATNLPGAFAGGMQSWERIGRFAPLLPVGWPLFPWISGCEGNRLRASRRWPTSACTRSVAARPDAGDRWTGASRRSVK
jgi:hypothetical protein